MSTLTRLVRVCLALTLALGTAALLAQRIALAQSRPARANGPKAGPDRPPSDAFDIRTLAAPRTQALQRLGRDAQAGAAAAGRLRQANEAIAALRGRLPDVEVRLSPLTGGVDLVRARRGSLTPPAAGAARDIATGFLQANTALYGLSGADVAALRFRGESVSPGSGLRMVRLEQQVNGLPVFQSDSRFLVDRDGRLVRTVGQFAAAGPAGFATPAAAPAITPAQALVAAMQSVGITIAESDVTIAPRVPGEERDILTVSSPRIGGPVTSHLVYFPLAPGVLALAYEQATLTDGRGDWLTLVDAVSGTLLWRKNARSYQASTQQARFHVYVQGDGVTPADSPAPQSPTTAARGAGTQFPAIGRTIVSMLTAQDPIASPSGWIPDGGTTTTGNNVDACVDRVAPDGCDTGTLDNDGRPTGNPDVATLNRDFLGTVPRDFTAEPAPLGTNPDAGTDPTGEGAEQDSLRRGAATQLFYVSNWYHDQLFQLGFDEAAGNFQAVNFSGQGLGGDYVRAEVQDASSTDNANFATFPDGTPGRMQMFRFVGPTPDRDAAFDSEIVLHELTHGLTNRLIGNGGGLMWSVGQALGEGWSDFYALSLLNGTQADNPDGRYAMGAYATYRFFGLTDNYVYGIRRFPYTTDNTINPLTWADVDDVTIDSSGGMPPAPGDLDGFGALQVHNAGELWALSLWEVRSRIIKDPAGANGNVAVGNRTMLRLVTDALKLTPNNPSVIDARDALLDADCATNACANERWIWEGFADRGLGYGASAPLGTAGFDDVGHMGVRTSHAMPALDVAGFIVDDTLGNGNGGIDPGEPVRLRVTLSNPWRRTDVGLVRATLATTTPGVTLLTTQSDGPLLVPAGGTASTAAPGFQFTVAPAVSCGQAIQFTLTIVDSLGTQTRSFTARAGLPSGVGAPVTFTRTANVAIPDGQPRGVTDAFAIQDDYEIADLDFRVDRLDHTFTGDLTVMLRAPNGYGTDLIWLRETLFAGGDGDDFINTIIDEQSANDLNQSLETDAPFTGRWAPAFNSGVWSLFGDPARFPDPVGQLSRLNGQSTRGTWHVHVTDQSTPDTGTLRGWSLIVTPRAYACTAFSDTTPPVTTITLAPAAPTGTNGWYRSPVTPAVAAVDPGPTGVVTQTRCVINPATAPAAFANLPAGKCPLTGGTPIPGDGTYTIWAASADLAGNTGTPVSASFRIDRTAPVLTCPAAPPRFPRNQRDAAITATVADAGSGAPASVTQAVDSNVPGNGAIELTATDGAGNVGRVTCPYVVNTERTYYLTEGATGFYRLSVALANPNPEPARITITLLKDDRTTEVLPRVLPAQSRSTVEVNEIPGFEALPVSVLVTSLDGLPLGVERTMTWDRRAYGGHGETGVQEPRRRWLFAEGAQGFFQTYVMLLNPYAEATTATVRFLREVGDPVTRTIDLPGLSRQVVDAGSVPELAYSAFGLTVEAPRPIVAERVTYFGNTPSYFFIGAHASMGAPDPSTRWYFSEGATGAIFDTYILVANPGDTDADITLRFLMDSGEAIEHSRKVEAGKRLTVDVESLGPRFSTAAFALELTSTQPVVSERAMYWVGDPPPWTEAHDSLGVIEPAPRWVLAEGRIGGPASHQTYVLLGNPGAASARVRVTFLRTNRPPVVQTYTVAATSRQNIFVNADVPELEDNEPFSTVVEVLDGPGIIAEHSIYWNAEGVVWAGGTNAIAMRLP